MSLVKDSGNGGVGSDVGEGLVSVSRDSGVAGMKEVGDVSVIGVFTFAEHEVAAKVKAQIIKTANLLRNKIGSKGTRQDYTSSPTLNH
jgi:hypothetical protein